ncbi:MAG: type II toxin-antitoxin system VapC family toxin [Rhodocyclaceae bacterium]|nr:type II toxin-antitoxin system VapC family toxin [Rhodocyclaceae bacterium]MDZ4214646.1 type II toxin-antitoxin system VapC family toxin [Rhodocyclaceae bacterium]
MLLDTHAWVWLMNGSRQLGPKAQKAVLRSLASEAVLVAAISPWEVAMLVSKGRLVLDRDVGEWVREALSQPGIRLEALTPEIAVASTRMPGELHGDPADRLLAATARHLGATLLTDDQLLLDYGKAGHIKTFKAGL